MDTRRLTVNCSILFTDLPLLRRPQAAREAGFDAVEFWWPFGASVPSDSDVQAFVSAIADAGMRLTHLNLAAGDLAAGERGLLSYPQTSDEFRDSVEVAIGIGKQLGTVGFNALYGNRIEGVDPAEQDALAAENLASAARAAATIDADILLEPLSAIPTYPLRVADDAISVTRRVRDEHGVDNIRLLADLYHLAVNGDDLDLVISRYADRIGHVQLADAPGRSEPGTGTIDFARHFAAFDTAGYPGWFSLEYTQTQPDPFAWIPEFASGAHE
ncbi:hydroxypyruvate isomerase family protein [Gordonia otitidis]|uniref:Hydroxypyruvate isomerase n=1 Tax=Gordonia otitidis (strain DSM 44809 / CCUG 52243 / JCM 12355 / NBRC 100426 / IFM 10032) TaxID=1108044 RepID=H5TQ85_GORO1|nr:TIM barrel protein [Gordonia otitidis]GAB35643.1 hydroxypyruvate isomerase [Gordonia otitidis NBRC 100426]